MKRIVFLITVVAVLALAASALSLVHPQGRRANGDPDEFQARQVLDEGITVAGSSLDAGSRSSEGQPSASALRAKTARQFEIRGRGKRPRVTLTFSGRTIFLER